MLPICCPFWAARGNIGQHAAALSGMARIHRRAPGTYEVVLESGHDPTSGKRQHQTFAVHGTKRDAERAAATRTAALASGSYVDPTRETVGEFMHRWLRDYVDPSISLRSRIRYRDIVEEVLVPHLGSVPIQQLKPAHILATEQEMRKSGNRKTGGPLAPASVRKIHNVLHRALRHAVAWQAIAHDDCRRSDGDRRCEDCGQPLGGPRVCNTNEVENLGHDEDAPFRLAARCSGVAVASRLGVTGSGFGRPCSDRAFLLTRRLVGSDAGHTTKLP